MSALMSTFKGSTSGESLAEAGTLNSEGVETSFDTSTPAANQAQIQVKPDIIQTLSQVAQPNGEAANQPKVKSQAEQQLQNLTSKPASLGSALSAGDGAGKANARMNAAEGASQKLSSQAAKLQQTIAAGGDQPKASSKESFGRAVMGAGIGAAPAVAATMAAGPTVGAAVAAATTAYDVAAVFSGRSGGGSSFKSAADSKGNVGYVSAPESPATAAPVSTAFMNKLSKIPGDSFGIADINLASQGLNGFEKAPKLDAAMPKLESTPAAKYLMSVNRNGVDVARADGEKPEADKESLDFKPTKPGNPGVFMPPKPLQALA